MQSENERELFRPLPAWRIALLPIQIAQCRKDLNDYERELQTLRYRLKQAIKESNEYMEVYREGLALKRQRDACEVYLGLLVKRFNQETVK